MEPLSPLSGDSANLQASGICNFLNLPLHKTSIPPRWQAVVRRIPRSKRRCSILRTVTPSIRGDSKRWLHENGKLLTQRMRKEKLAATIAAAKGKRLSATREEEDRVAEMNGKSSKCGKKSKRNSTSSSSKGLRSGNITFSPYNKVVTFDLTSEERMEKRRAVYDITSIRENIIDPTYELEDEEMWQIAKLNLCRNVEDSLPMRLGEGDYGYLALHEHHYYNGSDGKLNEGDFIHHETPKGMEDNLRRVRKGRGVNDDDEDYDPAEDDFNYQSRSNTNLSGRVETPPGLKGSQDGDHQGDDDDLSPCIGQTRKDGTPPHKSVAPPQQQTSFESILSTSSKECVLEANKPLDVRVEGYNSSNVPLQPVCRGVMMKLHPPTPPRSYKDKGKRRMKGLLTETNEDGAEVMYEEVEIGQETCSDELGEIQGDVNYDEVDMPKGVGGSPSPPSSSPSPGDGDVSDEAICGVDKREDIDKDVDFGDKNENDENSHIDTSPVKTEVSVSYAPNGGEEGETEEVVEEVPRRRTVRAGAKQRRGKAKAKKRGGRTAKSASPAPLSPPSATVEHHDGHHESEGEEGERPEGCDGDSEGHDVHVNEVVDKVKDEVENGKRVDPNEINMDIEKNEDVCDDGDIEQLCDESLGARPNFGSTELCEDHENENEGDHHDHSDDDEGVDGEVTACRRSGRIGARGKTGAASTTGSTNCSDTRSTRRNRRAVSCEEEVNSPEANDGEERDVEGEGEPQTGTRGRATRSRKARGKR
eukprot:GHVN01020437.1.p1 GENE.GHVN01020437.1~~GHVN01020437.1.p1  ORF type:complete len:758 (+),score=195.77 GHVN01020437.1:2360-4633(+)